VTSGAGASDAGPTVSVGPRFQRLGIDLERQFRIVGEHQLPCGPGPDFPPRFGIGEPRAESPRYNHDRRLDIRIGLHRIKPLQIGCWRRAAGHNNDRGQDDKAMHGAYREGFPAPMLSSVSSSRSRKRAMQAASMGHAAKNSMFGPSKGAKY